MTTVQHDQDVARSHEQEQEVFADQHEQHNNGVQGLLNIIERLRSQGYKLKVVGPVHLGPSLSE